MFQQHRLGAPVVFERAVDLEVLAGDVGDDSDVVLDPPDAVQLQPAGGRFHHGGPHAGTAHLRQQRLHLGRFERGIAAVVEPARVADLEVYRAHQAGAPPARRRDCVDQRAGSRFAVCAGDADHLHAVGWMAMERGGEGADRAARIGDAGIGVVSLEVWWRRVLADYQRGPTCQRVRDVHMAVGASAAHGYEAAPRRHLLRGGGDARNRALARAEDFR